MMPPAYPVGIVASPGDFVGLVPSQFNMVNAQNFALTAASTHPPGGWQKSGTTIASNVTGADRAPTASKIQEDTSNGNHVIGAPTFGPSLSMGDGVHAMPAVIFRCVAIAQAVERTRIVIQVQNATEQVSAGFDISGGNTTYDNSATGTFTVVATTMTQIVPGWWMCFLDYTTSTTSTNTQFCMNIYLDNGSGTAARSISYAGSTGSGVNIWFASWLPRSTWKLKKEVFLDHFTSLSTIDVNDTRAAGFNWYIHNKFPSTNQTGSCFFLNTPPTASNFSVANSIVTILGDAPGGADCGLVMFSGYPDPNNVQNVLGAFYSIPFIYEIRGTWDQAVLDANNYVGTVAPAWMTSKDVLISALGGHNVGAEIDVQDGVAIGGTTWVANAMEFNPLNPPTETFWQQGAAAGDFPTPRNLAVLHKMATITYSATDTDNASKGFVMSFSEGMYFNGSSSIANGWTSSGILQGSQMMAILGAGRGVTNPGAIPAVMNAFWDYARILQ